jgi:monoamine oxidase
MHGLYFYIKYFMKTDVIIVGAGASGLMAARELCKAGKSVLVLEARDRVGGRIHTIKNNSFSTHVEMGAEFVHGKLPITLGLLKEAGIEAVKLSGEMWEANEKGLSREESFIEGWDVFMEKLHTLEEDMSVDAFLERYFQGKGYEPLKESVRRFAEGFDTAEPHKASMLALREEWADDHEGNDFRPKDGYGKMIDFLVKEIMNNGGIIELSSVVKEVKWGKGKISVITTSGKEYIGHKLIVTVPLSILQSKGEREGNIIFSPALPEYEEQIQKMGFGSVIKVMVEFKERFWETDIIKDRTNGKDISNAAFIFSKEEIPTWWTRSPEKSSLLTGWLGGPKAKEIGSLSKEEIFDKAVTSLANIFGLERTIMQELISAWEVADWNNEPFTRGSYSYPTVGVNEARMKMAIPKEDTIYFAGEAIWQGPEAGTVEAALGSGKAVAESILRS